MKPTNLEQVQISLRRDRGYAYFPDVLKSCLDHKVGNDWLKASGKCYRRSSKQLFMQELLPGDHGPETGALFGEIAWVSRQGNPKTLLLIEGAEENALRYDFAETTSMHKIEGRRMFAETAAGKFASVFHRWAALCKILFHELEPNPSLRMLLLKLNVEERDPGTVSHNEEIRMDFLTKDHFCKFSVWRQGKLVGGLVAAGRPNTE